MWVNINSLIDKREFIRLNSLTEKVILMAKKKRNNKLNWVSVNRHKSVRCQALEVLKKIKKHEDTKTVTVYAHDAYNTKILVTPEKLKKYGEAKIIQRALHPDNSHAINRGSNYVKARITWDAE